MGQNSKRLRVLFVPDSVHWVTGTIAKSIARFNPWIEATIASGPVIDTIFGEQPELMNNFDLVHFTCPYASREWLPRLRELMPCVTSHHHTSDWDLLKHNIDGDAIIVGSPEWSQDLAKRGGDISKVFWVPYGVDAEVFTPVGTARRESIRQMMGIASDVTTVGFFGKNSSNEYDRKGIDVFTAAILSLNKKLSRLAVVIVGPGWQELVGSLTRAGVDCHWFPFVKDSIALAEKYRALDFYWVTSRVEGGPVTLLEAMSTEVCCLTTPVGLAREIVEDGRNAMLLPFNDAEAFTESTAALALDELARQRLARRGRQTILERMHVGLTATGVVKAYAAAFENFARRLDRKIQLDILAIATITRAATEPGNEVPLNGLPPALKQRVRMLESLAFSENLILYHNQRSVGIRMILREWMANPLSLMPPRVMLRRFLPNAIVTRLVKVRNRSRPAPELAAH